MPETTCEKIKRHCLPLTYAFTPSHMKSVLIGMVTEYESKFRIENLPIDCENVFLSPKNRHYPCVLHCFDMSICSTTYSFLCICLFNVV